jgi:hypothetical protein
MHRIFLLSLGFLAATALTKKAQANATPSEIRSILRNIDQELNYTHASPADLDDVKARLNEAYQIVLGASNTNPSPNPLCLNWAYSSYSQSLNSSEAMTRASQACRTIGDLDTAKFLYSKHSLTLNSASAMDLASQQATYALGRRITILEYAYDKYDQTLNSSAAATRAAQQSAGARVDALSCLSFSYDQHSQSLNSATAMDAAFVDCR